MGKAKKRGFTRKTTFDKISREEAVIKTVKLLDTNMIEAENLITLFGLSAEELLENGASYEVVKCKMGLLK